MILRGIDPFEIMIIVPVLLFSLSVHEYAHAFTAFVLGDVSQRDEGRLTLNPLRHIDWMGFACLVIAGFGWAKPVSVNPSYFARPPKDGVDTAPRGMKSGMAVTSLMGPMSNLILAFASIMIFYPLVNAYRDVILSDMNRITGDVYTRFDLPSLVFSSFGGKTTGFSLIRNGSVPIAPRYAMLILYQLSVYNLVLAAFNLIPLPPMDGSKLFSAFLPVRTYFRFINGGGLTTILLLIFIFMGGVSVVISPILVLGYVVMNYAAEVIYTIIPIYG